MKIAKKIILFGLCAALLIGASVMGTMAYLQSQSPTAAYSMGIGNVSITLADAAAPSTAPNEGATVSTEIDPYKLIPGTTIAKAPTITVAAGSQACWLFVKIGEEGSVKIGDDTYSCRDFLDYAIAEGWKQLNVEDEIIYYCMVEASADAQNIGILAADPGTETEKGKWGANEIYIKETVTKEMLKALKADDAELPSISFTAYAIQYSGFDKMPAEGEESLDDVNALAAWNAIVAQTAPETSEPATSESTDSGA